MLWLSNPLRHPLGPLIPIKHQAVSKAIRFAQVQRPQHNLTRSLPRNLLLMRPRQQLRHRTALCQWQRQHRVRARQTV
jgi:hypothetical protein